MRIRIVITCYTSCPNTTCNSYKIMINPVCYIIISGCISALKHYDIAMQKFQAFSAWKRKIAIYQWTTYSSTFMLYETHSHLPAWVCVVGQGSHYFLHSNFVQNIVRMSHFEPGIVNYWIVRWLYGHPTNDILKV